MALCRTDCHPRNDGCNEGTAAHIQPVGDCFENLYDAIRDVAWVKYVSPKPNRTKALAKSVDDIRTVRGHLQRGILMPIYKRTGGGRLY